MNNNELVWTGTQSEFDELTEYDENKVYIIVDEEEEAEWCKIVIIT